MSNIDKDWFKKIKHQITVKEIHPHHRHINTLLIITVFLIVLLLIIIKPAFLGYRISKQFEEVGMSVSEFMKEVDKVKSDLLISKTNLESCKSLNQEYLQNLAAEKNVAFQCSQEKSKLQSEISQLSTAYSFNISKIQTEFEQKKSEVQLNLTQAEARYDQLKTITDAIVKNAANNICCKAKVDNKNVDSYIISNGIIVCTTGETNKIIC